MGKYTLRYLPLAEQDLSEIVNYIQNNLGNPIAAENTLSKNGNFDWFQGKEIISFCGKEVYECYFHGGLIK